MRYIAAALSQGIDSNILVGRIFVVGNFKPVLLSLSRIIYRLSRTMPATKNACSMFFKMDTCFLALIYKRRKFAFLML